jgi:tetratricopeptide (TPR) repeat protein
MEAQNADANLGVMLFNQRRYQEASKQFEPALRAIDAMAAADPGNADYQKSLAESLAWVADSHLAEGRLDAAIADRQRDVRLVETLLSRTRDSEFSWQLVAAHRVLASLYVDRGRVDDAIHQVRIAVAHSEQLLTVEPTNSKWIERAAAARLDLADYLLMGSKTTEAAAEAKTACGLARPLYSRQSDVADWRALHRICLRVQAEVALASGAPAAALAFATQAIAVAKSVHSEDPITDRYSTAGAYQLLGDVNRALRRTAAAQSAWESGLALIPPNLTEQPSEISQHQALLQRLGRTAEAAKLANRLAAMGFRQTRSVTA